jgi:aquaporin Z
MSDSARAWLAEILGTFTLVFIGGLAILAGGGGGAALADGRGGAAGLVVLSFGFGLALLGGLYAFGEISGGHFNPAVSLAALIDKRIDLGTFMTYVVSQSGGAVIAGAAIMAVSSQAAVASTATMPGATTSTSGAFFLEVILTAIFVGVILKVTMSSEFGTTAFLAISFTLVAIHLSAANLSGASVNPARSLASALVGGDWNDFWVYVTAPFIGAAIGWLFYKAITTETGEKELA